MYAHLGRDGSAMHLDGALADAELGRDLLVQEALHQLREDFKLALREVLEATGNFAEPPDALAFGRVVYERLADGRDKPFGRRVLLDEVVGAVLHGTHGARYVSTTRQEQDR